MPYISQDRRGLIDQGLADPKNAGELNYAFTRLALAYLATGGLSYQHINDIVGALEGAKLEMYRRIATGYEESKRLLNGDVFEEGK